MELFTIGHSNHPIAAWLTLLTEADVREVVDVRRFPSSRHHPQYNQGALARSLESNGWLYRWLGESIGGRREPDLEFEVSPNKALTEPGLRSYADAMTSPAFLAGLRELERVARRRPVALLCAERDWRRCHRALLSDLLTVRGWTIEHLGAPQDAPGRHRLSPHARPGPDGTVTYPGLW